MYKAMVFPVVMYGCESWTIKKAECRKIDAFELWCWRRLLRSLPLLFSTQLSESLCVLDCGGHLGNWLLAGSVSLLFTPPFYPPGHLCLLPPSSLPYITPWTSLSGPDCGAHIRKWLLASLLSPLLIPPHLILSPLSPSSLFFYSCNSVNISGCPSL